MANVLVTPLFPMDLFTGTAITTHLVDATNDSAGAILTAPKTGNISAVGRPVTAVGGTGTTGTMRMETVSGAAGSPTGTIFAAGADATDDVSATGWAWKTLNTPAAVTKGNDFAVVYTASAADGTNNATFGYGLTGVSALRPYSVVRTAGTWSFPSVPPLFAAKYDDGEIILGCYPLTAIGTSTNIASDTTPDEVGVKWTAPTSGSCIGLSIMASVSSLNLAGTAKLYQGDSTELETSTFAASNWRAAFATARFIVHFDSAVAVAAGTVYRATFLPTVATATGNIRLVDMTFESADSLQRTMTALAQKCSRTDAGAWTDTSTNIVSVTPLMSAASGAGLLVHPGMTGGIRG